MTSIQTIRSGMPRQEIIAFIESYFQKEMIEDTIISKQITVKVFSTSYKSQLNIKIPQTPVEIRGEAPAVAEFTDKFRKRFLSAGG